MSFIYNRHNSNTNYSSLFPYTLYLRICMFYYSTISYYKYLYFTISPTDYWLITFCILITHVAY